MEVQSEVLAEIGRLALEVERARQAIGGEPDFNNMSAYNETMRAFDAAVAAALQDAT